MAKVLGNYSSIVRGVSQQAPADRKEGQHGEVLNLLSDPIRGLVRRNGTILEHQIITAVTGDTPGDAVADSFSFRTYSFRADERELDLLYRSRTKVGSSADHLDGILVYDKSLDTGAGFVSVVTDAADPDIAGYMNGGFSAVTAIGSYVLLAGNAVLPTYSYDDKLVGEAWSYSGVAWVRGGNYGRTYKLVATRQSTGVTHTVTYTTKTAAYPGSLDTSGISYTATDYQKQINDLTYAYNAAVNQWISDASADIVPSHIAQKLVDAMTTDGWSGWYINGSHIGHPDISFMEVSDGGDGSLFVSLLNQTAAADEVTEMHHIGKVIRVQPKSGSTDAFYLKAFAKDGSPDASTLRPVIWRETAGVLQTPTRIFALGVLHNGVFYVASTPTRLAALVLDSTSDHIDVPQFIASEAGDLDSSKPPHFYGARITAMAVFQDRLVVASDSTVNLSRPGDYFNFYRSTVLTVPDDDPIEVYALGSTGDTIHQALVYDRSLYMYGDKFHYAMNGRSVQTPATASIAVSFTIDNTAGARPVAAGQYIFSLREDVQLAAARAMQTQPGVFQDSPQLTDISAQLRDYINGTPAEMVAINNPNMLFVRTEHFLRSVGAFPRARPNGIYVYQYLDNSDSTRLVDAWSAWEWSAALGTPIGMSATESGDGLMIYTLAWGQNESDVPVRGILAMSVSVRPDPTGLPYIDGMRKASDAAANGLLTSHAVTAVRAITVTAAGSKHSNITPDLTDENRFAGLEHPHYTMGDAPAETVDPFRWTGTVGNLTDYESAFPDASTDDLWTGVQFPAFVDITNPFVRDFHGRAKTWGRLTLSRIRATLIRTAGFDSKTIDHTGTKQGTHFAGIFERIRYGVNVWVGRDTREVQVRLAARDWLPLTINALEWAGQWFEPIARK
jgi:hypothetical protein